MVTISYNFSLSREFMNELKSEFLNKRCSRREFEDKWFEWHGNHINLLVREQERLENQGFTGNFLVKIKKTARYWLPNKETKKAKKRKKYTKLPQILLKGIINHIEKSKFSKPSDSYDNYIQSINIDNLFKLEKNLNKENFCKKLKITYKNRFYRYNK